MRELPGPDFIHDDTCFKLPPPLCYTQPNNRFQALVISMKHPQPSTGDLTVKPAPATPKKGLARSLLGGEGDSLIDVFDKIRNYSGLTFLIENVEKEWFGARLEVNETEGSGHWEFCQFGEDFYVVISDLIYAEPRQEYCPGDGLLQFHIKLSGNLTMMLSRTDPIEVTGPSLLVWAQPEGLDVNELAKPTKDTSVTLYFKPSYILNEFVTSTDQIPSHLARFVLNEENSINYCQLPITSEVLDAASSVIQSTDRFKGLLWLHHVHAKGKELICNIISAFDQLATIEHETYNKQEIQQLREAKKIASEEFDPPPTIKQIAKLVGTNETKLKYGFKSLFGETIFEYRNRRRMKKAMELIEEGISIGRVSEQVGYQHQTSFTSAFKSYYGLSPKDCRKMPK